MCKDMLNLGIFFKKPSYLFGLILAHEFKWGGSACWQVLTTLILFCRCDLSHLLLFLRLPGCCDHPPHVHAISDHLSLHADLHWEGEASWWVPKCPVLSEVARQKSAYTACSASINFGSSSNDLGIQLLRVKVKWYFANYGLFHFDCLGGNGFMGINTKKLSQEWVNISKTCFHCQELWSDPSPIALTSTSTFLNLTLGSIMWLI